MFDLNSLAINKTTFDLQLRHPTTDEPLFADKEDTKPLIITVFGPSSKEHRQATAAIQSKHLRRGTKKASLNELKEDSVEFLAACTEGSKNFVVEGKEPKTLADFKELYSNASYDWIRKQVDEAIGDVANFLTK